MFPTKISLEDFLGGHEVRFESIRKERKRTKRKKKKYCSCLFKIDGKKHRAKICFQTGIIKIRGQVVRRCNVC